MGLGQGERIAQSQITVEWNAHTAAERRREPPEVKGNAHAYRARIKFGCSAPSSTPQASHSPYIAQDDTSREELEGNLG
jgi:hypothetical protein